MKYNTISRDSIYVGQVAKVNTVRIKDGKYIPEIYKLYRSILFNMDNDHLCNDLIYDSPKYAVLNYTDNNTYFSVLLKEQKHWGFEDKIVVINALNIGLFLQKLGFSKNLTAKDILFIKNEIFNKRAIEKYCYTLGLIPSKEIIDSVGWYNRNDKQHKYTVGPTNLYNEMSIYRNAIIKYGSDSKSSILTKGFKVNLNAFKPSKKEGKIKILRK